MKLNEVYETEILRLNNEGEAVAIINGMIVFIPFALQGEIVKVKIIEINKNYAKGELLEIKEKSLDRRVEICPFFYECGGCNLMHMDYEKQL